MLCLLSSSLPHKGELHCSISEWLLFLFRQLLPTVPLGLLSLESAFSTPLQVWMLCQLQIPLLVGLKPSWKKLGSRCVSHLSGAMRLVQFHPKESAAEPRIGLEEKDGGDVVDLNAFDPSLPSNMRAFLEGGDAALAVAKRYLEVFRVIKGPADWWREEAKRSKIWLIGALGWGKVWWRRWRAVRIRNGTGPSRVVL